MIALNPIRAALELPWTHVDDLYVDGAWMPALTDRRSDVIDPVTEQVWGSVPDASPADVDLAVGAARAAFDAGPWPRMTPQERAAVMLRAADEIEQRAEALSWTNTRENGSPVMETSGAAANAASILRYFASLADRLVAQDIRTFPAGGAETVVQRDPVGVCALIAPWNFPINLVVIKLAPALLAGCTVVIKPAPPTPLSIRFVVEALAAAGVPDGVVNLITGEADAGDYLVRHPGVDKVAFTGSTPVGRRIAAACGELLRPVTLELGGKSSAIVLADADLDAMSGGLVRACLRNSGQTCYISTRILAPASRYDEVVDMVTRTITESKLGDPFDVDTVFGPVATAAQYHKVLGYLESARSQGARATTGGHPAPGVDLPADSADQAAVNSAGGRGYFIEPTVYAEVTPNMTVAREEIFGPVITVLRYRDVDEAVTIANGTSFGLGGIVFSGDPDRALAVAERIDSGSVGINFFASNHSAPFGGRHDSGLGVEYGMEGLGAYLTFKSIHRRTTTG